MPSNSRRQAITAALTASDRWMDIHEINAAVDWETDVSSEISTMVKAGLLQWRKGGSGSREYTLTTHGSNPLMLPSPQPAPRRKATDTSEPHPQWTAGFAAGFAAGWKAQARP